MEATRIAIVQMAPAFLDRAECLRIAVSAVAGAAAGGARLIVFSEAFIPG
jgi:nitrilase